MENFDGIDLDSARRVAGNGFYYLMGDIARLHSAVISYARDFMINRGFTYCVPPFMIRSSVVTGVMSFAEMEAMMYKIEGEDLYLIGTSEHSMIGKFIDQIIPEEELPKTLSIRLFRKKNFQKLLQVILRVSVKKKEHTDWKREAFTVFTRLNIRKLLLYDVLRKARNGLKKSGRIQWIYSALWIFRFVLWNAVPEIWQT